MIAVDTNLLVYAHRPEMPFHERARQVLTEAVEGAEPPAAMPASTNSSENLIAAGYTSYP